MNSIEDEDKIKKIIKYGKYLIIIIVVSIAFLIFKSKGTNYKKYENQLIEEAKQYVISNNINTNGEIYIEATKLELIEGMELCSKTSGVLISNNVYYAYLNCPGYKSKIGKTNGKYITLNGDGIMFINKNEIFNDPLYVVKVALLDGDVNINGVISGNVGVYTLNYEVYYNLKKEEESRDLVETLSRKVVVLENNTDETISGLRNTEEPYLELFGDKNIILSLGEKYEEPGYKAYDYEDGKISRQVKITGKVDNKKAGNYVLLYNVTNSKGISAVETRNVSVVLRSANLDIQVEKKVKDNKVYVNIKVLGDGYKSLRTLNGEDTISRDYSFIANENKPYVIRVTDTYGNTHIKEINVNEIDTVKPIGSCKAVTMHSKTSVSVEASDDKGIAGYNYKINNSESGFITQKNYEANESAKTVSVTIKDVSGNTTDVNCSLEQGNEEYINEKGYNCIYPFTCYKQGDYSSEQYQFCSTDTCGPINKRGCSITSVTTIISGFGVKDKNGNLYTPYTLLTDVYKKVCSVYCSGNTAARRVFEYVGLRVVGESYYNVNRANMEILKEHLKKGGAALLRVGPGWYTNGGHLMALLSINDKDEVYLYDPGRKIGTSNGSHNVNTFVPTDDLIQGNATWFQLVSK